jgi:hypothetical protein
MKTTCAASILHAGAGVVRQACSAVLLAFVSAVFAAHPLQTEDTGTQGSGNFEFENGLSLVRQGPASTFTYQPQLSIGVDPALDLIVQPSWIRSRGAGSGNERGLGDTNLDAKWRFLGSTPWSLAARFGVGLATSQHDVGIPRGTIASHAVLAATYKEAPWALHANAALAHTPVRDDSRENVLRVSSAVMWTASERWIFTIDLGAATSAQRGSDAIAASALVGAIWTVQHGLDVDAGLQQSFNTRSSARTWLLGLTYRFAP